MCRRSLALLATICSLPLPALAAGSGCPPQDAPAVGALGEAVGGSVEADLRALAASQRIVFAEVLERAQGAVDATRQAIGAAGREITTLEAENAAKATRIGQLQGQLLVRTEEIAARAQRTRTLGVFAALMGVPMVAAVSVVQLQDQDGKVRELTAEIKRLEGEKTSASARIKRYRREKSLLTERLTELEDLEHALPAEPAPVSPDGSIHRYFVTEIARLEARKAVAANLRQQLAVLTQIRDKARELGGYLDGVIADLQGSVALADRLAADSEEEFMGLFQMLVRKDNAAATRWLTSRLEAQVEGVRAQVRTEVTTYVDGLLSEAIPRASPVRDQLAQRLIGSLLGGP